MSTLPLDGVPLDKRPLPSQNWPEYTMWASMLGRCYYPSSSSFHRYGGRGIAVCDRWRESFDNFIADMGPRPTAYHQIDRVNNDGNYEPTNCRWVTRAVQAQNKPRTASFRRTLIGDVVRAVRVHRQITQEDVARPGGCSRVEIAQVESGKNQMSSAAMRETVALGLGVTVATVGDIVTGKSSPEVAALAFGVPVEVMRTAWAAVAQPVLVKPRRRRSAPGAAPPASAPTPDLDDLWEAACSATIGGC